MARDGPPKSTRLLEMSNLRRLRRRRSPAEQRPGDVGNGRGFSRLVHCNDSASPEALALKYPDNAISTTKYTLANFVPKSLFEQFRRAANVFFLVVACISFSPLAPYRAVSILLPLVVVVGATMAKEAVEDWQRKKQDIEINNRKVEIYNMVYSFHLMEWKKLRVGDIVKVEKDEFFPADLLLLSTSYDDGTCYVETMNLDGETNLKRKQSLKETSNLQNEHSLRKFKALIKCEDPNEKLYSFIGTLNVEGIDYPLSPQQILLRDSKLRNTQHVYGVVVFTGHDTKVMQNAMEAPSKRSNIEKRMDKIIYLLFACLAFIASLSSILFGITTRKEDSPGNFRWYLRPDNSSILFNPKKAVFAAIFLFLTSLMLYGCLIPIALYISIEIVKVLQSTFIDHDHAMYCEDSDKPARARTSNLNEELGQVNTILSDKTGTLTCNSMEFLKCSIAGVAYGNVSSEVEKDFATETFGELLDLHDPPTSSLGLDFSRIPNKSLKGIKFSDERLMNGQWAKERHSDLIQKFFQALAICQTAIPTVHKHSDEISYEAESPDEAAFVKAAKELGFEFHRRTQTSISLREFDPNIGRKVDRTYELLNVLEFNSARKRMSVIVRTEENQLLLLCKGADSVIFERLSKHGQIFESSTKHHISYYSEAGLRTLAVAYRILSEEEYITWNNDFVLAKSSLNTDHDAVLDEAAERIEKDLILLGATAVEDKLQDGVPECINKLAQAGIKIWILTGDKLETAVNIGFACQLLRKGMEQIVISLNTPNITALKKGGNKNAIETALNETIAQQLREAQSRVSKSKGSSILFALIIDGDALAFALSKSLEESFLDLAVDCASVICCRTSPKQKALVTGLVKRRTKKTTLAIGDGANDVGMLQEADIGVGISGVEGMQAVMSSDFSIAQFRFLERLLLVHGHWCYRRIAAMICYFFYKNITFGFTLFWFEAHALFSAQPAYNDWFMSFYNVAFTSLPVIALGVFDKDIPSHLCLEFPLLHQDGVKNIFFSWARILGWVLNGAYSSLIIYYLTTSIIFDQAFRQDGQPADYGILGVTMYTCVVWTVNCQLAIYLSYFTWIQHLFIWGSILFWYVVLVIYGFFPVTISTTAHKVFLEAVASTPLYWLTTLFAVISALLPYFCYSMFQKMFFPNSYDILQRLQVKKRIDHM